jgi:hypothetical protein
MAALTGVYAQDRTHAPLVAAIRLGPRSIAGYLTGSHIDERSGDYAHALDDADQAVRLEPRSATALNARCWNGAILSRLDAAPDDCDAAVAPRPYSMIAGWFQKLPWQAVLHSA